MEQWNIGGTSGGYQNDGTNGTNVVDRPVDVVQDVPSPKKEMERRWNDGTNSGYTNSIVGGSLTNTVFLRTQSLPGDVVKGQDGIPTGSGTMI